MVPLFIYLVLAVIPVTMNSRNNPSAGEEADSLRFTNHIFSEEVRTLFISRKGWDLSYPIMELNSGEKLEISFDYLGSSIPDLSYTFVHCNSHWEPSPIFPADYIEGFYEDQIHDYAFSFNTTVKYIHYDLTFPNELIDFKISGNYVLHIYRNGNPEDLLLSQRFVIYENKAGLEIEIRRPALAEFMDSGQEIDFTINHQSYEIKNPYQDIAVVICQNNRWDNAITDLHPSFIRNNTIIYDYSRENIHNGGSEYRYFDIKSFRYQSEYIEHIDYKDEFFHVLLYPDELRSSKGYFYHEDLNGKYYIDVQEQTRRETDADYAFVYFTLPYTYPIENGHVYVYGALSYWGWNQRNRMRYNPDNQSYELSMLLKQGYYNYEYIFVPDGEHMADNSYFEGNHFETENDYVIYVYHRDPSFRYEKLIGVGIANSLRK